jgi:ankyrin repeat protein
MYTNNIMSRLTELKEEEYDIVIQLLTEFTKKIQNKDVAQILNNLKKTKNINAKDSYGWNFLMWASRTGDFDIVKLLLDRGATIDDKDNSGSTSLMFASYSGHFDIVQLLLERGANVNLTNNIGETALHNACKKQSNIPIITELLKYGADPNITNKYKQKPIDVFKGTAEDKTEVENLIKKSIILHGVESIDSSIGKANNPFGVNVSGGFENFENLKEYMGGKRKKSKRKKSRRKKSRRRKN